MSKYLLNILAILLFVTIPPYSAAKPSFTDATILPAYRLKLYKEIRNDLNEWPGTFDPLCRIGSKINDFISSEPTLLPIYIEKARYTIKTGFLGDNDTDKYVVEALIILSDIQKKAPNYAKAYILAGHAYTLLKKYDDAKHSLSLAEKIGSRDPWLAMNWSTLLADKKERRPTLYSAIWKWRT